MVRPLAATLLKDPSPPALLLAAYFYLCAGLCLGLPPLPASSYWRGTKKLVPVRGTIPWSDSCSSWGHQKGGNKWPGQERRTKDSAFWKVTVLPKHCLQSLYLQSNKRAKSNWGQIFRSSWGSPLLQKELSTTDSTADFPSQTSWSSSQVAEQ